MAGQPLRRQWPANQRGLKAKMKPPSPCGYTGLLVEMYYPVKSTRLMVAFDNEESGYRYTYRVPNSMKDQALEHWKLLRYHYLVIDVDDDEKETIIKCDVAKFHDGQKYGTERIFIDFN